MIYPVSVLFTLSFPRLASAIVSAILLATAQFVQFPIVNAEMRRPGQQIEDVRQLPPGSPIEREISGSDTHVWLINLSSGDYLRLWVARKQIKLAAKLFSPNSDGQKDRKPLLSTVDRNVIFEHDSNSKLTATFSLLAEVSGTYRLEMSLLDKNLPSVNYEIKIETLRQATPDDRLRVAAERDELDGNLIVADNDITLEKQLLRLEKYNSALAAWRQLGDRKNELKLLLNTSAVYQQLGEPQTTLKYQSRAIQIARELGDRYQEANLTLAMGIIQYTYGDHQKALDSYNQARQIFAGLSKRYGEAIAIKNIGTVYLFLGEAQMSLDYFNQALQTFSSAGDAFSQSDALNGLGMARRVLGEKQLAVELHLQALEIVRQNKIVAQEAVTLGFLGSDYAALGDNRKAADCFNRQLTICQRMGNRRCVAASLHSLGNVSFLLGEKEKALDYLNESLNQSRLAGERRWESDALFSLARLNHSIGNLNEARKQIETALEIRESLRANLARQDLRATFFSSTQSGFELYINLLMTLHQQQPSNGFDAAALQASERARARSLLEQLAETNSGIRQGVDPQLLELERTLQQQLNAKASARANAFNKKETETLARSFDTEIVALTNRYHEVKGQIRATSPRYAALTLPEPLAANEIQRQLLDENTILLEFSLGERQSWLWVVTPTDVFSHQLPARSEIETVTRRVYELLTARQPAKGETEAEWKTRVTESDARLSQEMNLLSRMLLGPIAARLGQEWKDKRLLIVASGALEYLPFAALTLPSDGNNSQPLIVGHEIVNLPSASVLSVLRREKSGRRAAAKTLAVLADPVFEANDPRVILAAKNVDKSSEVAIRTRSADGAESPLSYLQKSLRSFDGNSARASLSRLPFSRDEADSITSFVPAKSFLKATDFQASRATAMSAELANYRIIHFATHGLLNSEHPELSGLALSLFDESGKEQNGFLRMHEIYNLNLPAEIVVLSACQTGLGKEIKGEGLVGLTRGFMYAGAERVVASLWQVDDLATAELMERFYRGMLKDGLRPAAALRLAQIEMMKQKRWSPPYFWAGFVLSGEWR